MRFERKKLFSNKIIIALIALILAAEFVFLAYTVGTFSKTVMSPEQNEAMKLAQMEYNEQYRRKNESLIRSAERIKSESSDRYTVRLSDRIISVCKKSRELPIGDNAAVTWFRVVLNDSYLSLLLMFFCVIISAELSCCDRVAGIFQWTFSSKNGRLVLYRHKIFTLMACSACAAVAFTAVQLATALPKGLTGIAVPIQTDSAFLNCAYNINFAEFVLVTVGMRILHCWFVCFFTACIAFLSGNLIASSAISASFCALLLILYDRTFVFHGSTVTAPTKYALHHTLLKFSPVCLLTPDGYFVSRDYVNVFGFPITELHFSLAFTVLVTAALAALGAYLFSRKRRALS